jgi:hypothetical protein
MRRFTRGLALLLGWACLILFFSVAYERTQSGGEDRTRVALGFTPDPWYEFTRTTVETHEHDGAYQYHAYHYSWASNLRFPALSWAFGGGAIALLAAARLLRPRGAGAAR